MATPAASHGGHDSGADAEARPLLAEDLVLLRRWRSYRRPTTAEAETTDAELAAHVVAVWRDVKARAHVYRCVERLSFLHANAPRLPGYDRVIARARERGPAFRVLDVGCAFGQETRALILDGVPPASCVATDVTPTYWQAGRTLFGDDDADDGASPSPLNAVTTVFGNWAAELDGNGGDDVAAPFVEHFDAVLCVLVLHVLSARQQQCMLARLARSAQPGAILIGVCVGVSGEAVAWNKTPDGTAPRWLNSCTSLTEALRTAGWDGEVHVGEAPATSWPAALAMRAGEEQEAGITRSRLFWRATKAGTGKAAATL